jgi:hypothetical protein
MTFNDIHSDQRTEWLSKSAYKYFFLILLILFIE